VAYVEGRAAGDEHRPDAIRNRGLGLWWQAKIAISCQRRGLRGRADGRAVTSNPAAERRDDLSVIEVHSTECKRANHSHQLEVRFHCANCCVFLYMLVTYLSLLGVSFRHKTTTFCTVLESVKSLALVSATNHFFLLACARRLKPADCIV